MISQVLTECEGVGGGLIVMKHLPTRQDRFTIKGTIPILRQQRDWVSGFRQLLLLLTVFMLIYALSM